MTPLSVQGFCVNLQFEPPRDFGPLVAYPRCCYLRSEGGPAAIAVKLIRQPPLHKKPAQTISEVIGYNANALTRIGNKKVTSKVDLNPYQVKNHYMVATLMQW